MMPNWQDYSCGAMDGHPYMKLPPELADLLSGELMTVVMQSNVLVNVNVEEGQCSGTMQQAKQVLDVVQSIDGGVICGDATGSVTVSTGGQSQTLVFVPHNHLRRSRPHQAYPL